MITFDWKIWYILANLCIFCWGCDDYLFGRAIERFLLIDIPLWKALAALAFTELVWCAWHNF